MVAGQCAGGCICVDPIYLTFLWLRCVAVVFDLISLGRARSVVTDAVSNAVSGVVRCGNKSDLKFYSTFVCLSLHIAAQDSYDDLPSYRPNNHHCLVHCEG